MNKMWSNVTLSNICTPADEVTVVQCSDILDTFLWLYQCFDSYLRNFVFVIW